MHFSTIALSLTASFSTVAATSLRGAKISSQRDNLDNMKTRRHLAIAGECTVDNFADAVGGNAILASYLDVANTETALQQALNEKCAAALIPTVDLSDTLGKGPQFLKNFLDGGTTWNENKETEDGSYSLEVDAAVIPTAYNDAKTTVFSAPDGGANDLYPRYFSNFYRDEKECVLGVIQCCYTGTRSSTVSFDDNAEMCAMDLADASKSNHIKNQAFTYFDTQPENEAYCSGFAYEKDSFEDAVKYNTLFHMAMKSNLYDKGYVKNIPGAPLCGCLEQMPIVDNADCVKTIEGYTIDANGNVSLDMSWGDCETDLQSYYDSLDERSPIEKGFVKGRIVGPGQCPAAAKSFMNDRMFVEAS
jgi:hypothetical protein